MSGFGNGPFGSNPLGLASIAGLPEAPIKLVTSRSIGVNGKEAQEKPIHIYCKN
jgi:hypothetical protein